MHGRFSCPRMTEIAQADWPDEFHQRPTTLMQSLESTCGLQIHLHPTILRQFQNHDLGVMERMWSVTLYIKEIDTDEAMRLESFAPVHDGDTPESVAMEFACEVIRSIDTMIQQGEHDGTEDECG